MDQVHLFKMDRGAARSRKRATKPIIPTEALGESTAGPSTHAQSRPKTSGVPPRQQSLLSSSHGPGQPHSGSVRPPRESSEPKQPHRFQKQRKGRQDNSNTDPANFQPKAIRTSAALIFSKDPFPIPPTKEVLQNVRRVDLEGSGVTDVGFLQGTGVTWLSLKGCKVTQGWEAVGGLSELAGECTAVVKRVHARVSCSS